MPSHKSNMLHLSCITTCKYDNNSNINLNEKIPFVEPILEQGYFILHLFQFHLSDRNDASKYGVLEDYVFDEDCTSFTKVVRAYADKEDSEDFSKFQVCNLKCVLE